MLAGALKLVRFLEAKQEGTGHFEPFHQLTCGNHNIKLDR